MLIYRDKYTGDELCTDANKITIENGIMRVYCKYVKRSTDVQCNTGANASEEEQAEEYEDSAEESGIDVCINHGLEEVTSFYQTGKDYNKYLKSYIKTLGNDYHKEKEKPQLKALLAAFTELKTIILEHEDDIQFFKAPYKDTPQQQEEEQEGQDKIPDESFHIPVQRINDKESIMYFIHVGLRQEKV